MSTDSETRPREATAEINPNAPRDVFARMVVTVVGITVAVLLALLLLWYAVDVLLLVFAGILLAIFLRGLGDKLSKRTGLSGGWSLGMVMLSLVAVIGVAVWLLAPSIAEQTDELTQSLPRAVERLQSRMERYGWARRVMEQLPSAEELVSDRADAFARVTGVFSTTLGALANFVIILFVGLYLAVEPRLYVNGLIRLVPLGRRDRAREALNAVGYALRWWLIGKVGSMIVIGVLTWLGLWLLGVPLALTLGIIAALLTFIPNIGPILSVVPAALLALLDSPTRALYVLLLYFTVQVVESYLLTPLVQRRTVSLPPALTIAAQVLLGVLLGGLGVVLATPLTAVALVLVKMLYVEDVLGDPVEVRGTESDQRPAH